MAPRRDHIGCLGGGVMNQNHRYEPVNLFWWIVAAMFLLLFLIVQKAKAQYREIEQETEVITDVTVGGDSSRVYGFSHSLGDVDINECIVTHQKGSFIVSWQGYDYNAWCMGEVYDRKGLVEMGALMRCDIPVIRQHFTSDLDCKEANTVSFEVTGSPEIDALKDRVARYDEDEDERNDQFEELTTQLQQQQQMIDQNQAQYQQIRVERPQIIQQYGLTEEKKAALRAILEED